VSPDATLLTVRELSLLSISQPLSCLCLIANRVGPPVAVRRVSDALSGTGTPAAPDSPEKCLNFGDWRSSAPTHCVLLRWGGLMSLLDMDTGSESLLFQVGTLVCNRSRLHPYCLKERIHCCHSAIIA
jgi:hypothetical protein